jgi:ectoine hydroxylase-related dioxygenase (phytanoyl-CoA dioxygenase family)
MRARVVEQAAGERAAGIATIDGGGANQRIWNLISKGQVFRDIVLKPFAQELLQHVIGPDMTLSSLTANIAGPGGEPMILHSDQGYVPRDTPYPVVANIMWMLDDFSEENGGTRVVPGSHRKPPPDPRTAHDSVAAAGPAGTAMVFDGRIWHGTGPNRTQILRHGVLSYFCRPFLRPQENMTLSTHPDVLRNATPELLKLLGFKIWSTLGGVQGPFAPDVKFTPAPDAELDPDNPFRGGSIDYGSVSRDMPFVGELTADGAPLPGDRPA